MLRSCIIGDVITNWLFEGVVLFLILHEFRLIGRDSQDFLKVFNHFIDGDGLHRENLRVKEIQPGGPLH